MEDTKSRWPQVLAVLRAFSSGRLEKQVLSRAYELAVPVVRVSAQVRSISEANGEAIRYESGSHVIAKGA